MFKEKVLSLGSAIILLLVGIAATYLVTSQISNNNNELTMPSLPTVNTPKPAEFSDIQLFLYACIDAYDTDETEIRDLGTIEQSVSLISFEREGITLCYPIDEIKTKKPKNKSEFLALLGLHPDTSVSSIVLFDATPENVFRPAYSTDCTKNEMSIKQCELSNSQKEFINQLIIDAADKKIAYTRLGYTYNYKGSDVYGVTQYATDPQNGKNISQTNLEDFLLSLNE